MKPFPLARGGEPYGNNGFEMTPGAFPTHVGVNRTLMASRPARVRFPHARGGEPLPETAPARSAALPTAGQRSRCLPSGAGRLRRTSGRIEVLGIGTEGNILTDVQDQEKQ